MKIKKPTTTTPFANTSRVSQDAAEPKAAQPEQKAGGDSFDLSQAKVDLPAVQLDPSGQTSQKLRDPRLLKAQDPDLSQQDPEAPVTGEPQPSTPGIEPAVNPVPDPPPQPAINPLPDPRGSGDDGGDDEPPRF